MLNKSFIANYLGAHAAAVEIWQHASALGGCSERGGGGLSVGAPTPSPECSCRRFLPFPRQQCYEGCPKHRAGLLKAVLGEMRDERKQCQGGGRWSGLIRW